jgi:hypothetical protein
MTHKLLHSLISLCLLVTANAKAGIVSLDEFSKTYDKAIEILEKDNQKVSIEFSQFNGSDSLLMDYKLISWRWNGQVFTNNNGVEYLYNGKYMIVLQHHQNQMILYSSKQSKEVLEKSKNVIDYTKMKTDSILKEDFENSVQFTLFPLANDDVAYVKLEINKQSGKLETMSIEPISRLKENELVTKITYSYKVMNAKKFTWKLEDYIKIEGLDFFLQKKYSNYQLFNYTK